MQPLIQFHKLYSRAFARVLHSFWWNTSSAVGRKNCEPAALGTYVLREGVVPTPALMRPALLGVQSVPRDFTGTTAATGNAAGPRLWKYWPPIQILKQGDHWPVPTRRFRAARQILIFPGTIKPAAMLALWLHPLTIWGYRPSIPGHTSHMAVLHQPFWKQNRPCALL